MPARDNILSFYNREQEIGNITEKSQWTAYRKRERKGNKKISQNL